SRGIAGAGGALGQDRQGGRGGRPGGRVVAGADFEDEIGRRHGAGGGGQVHHDAGQALGEARVIGEGRRLARQQRLFVRGHGAVVVSVGGRAVVVECAVIVIDASSHDRGEGRG